MGWGIACSKSPSPVWLTHCPCSADKLGTGLALVKSDINGNITRLTAAQSRDPDRYQALYPIILDEVEHGQPTASSSDTNGLLWLKRWAAAYSRA